MRNWTMVVAVLVGAACGRPGEGPADAAVADAGMLPVAVDAGMPDAGTPHFVPGALPAGTAVFLKAVFPTPTTPRIEVWGQGISPVLGLAFHLGVDGTQLRIDAAGADPVLGVDGRYLQRVRGADVAFGLARLGGETDLTVPARLAVVELTALTTVDSLLTLERVQARRADGSFVSVATATGRLVVPGGGK